MTTKKIQKRVMKMTSDDRRVMSGFPSLDKITGGFRPGTVNVIAGRPGVGKTTFALNMAYNAAVKYNKRVFIISLEESKEELLSKIALFSLKDLSDIERYPIFIDDKYEDYEVKIVACRKAIEEIHPDLIIIDYLELLTQDVGSRESRVAKATSFLRELATKNDVPVIVLKQLHARLILSDKPQLSDVAKIGCDTVVQESDVVIIIWWEGYTSKSREVHLASSRNVHLDVAKNKFGDGDVGVVVKFERAKCKYYEEE